MIVRALAVLIVSLLLAAACADDDSNGDANGTGTPGPSVCDEADDLQQSVDELTQLDIIATGTNGLNAAIDQVRSDAESLTMLAGTDVADEAAVLTNAIEQADETLSTLDDEESLLAATAEVGVVIAIVATAADELVTALSFECG